MSELFKCQIQCDGAAFEDGSASEIARILREIANKLEQSGPTDYKKKVYDLNGNLAGFHVLQTGK